jgi:proteasomal ATPase-associated factor 1
MSLNIISADPNPEADFQLLSVARTLKGHKAAVTDTHIVGVGKTVYSCGKDGSIRLWDVAQGSKIGSTLTSEGFNPILRMSTASAANNTGSTDPGASSEGHIIYAALQNGTFNIFDTRTSTLVYASPLARRAHPLLSIAHDSSSQLLATGTTAGVVEIYDTRQLPSSSPSNLLCGFKRSDASIDDLLFTDSSRAPPSLLVATGDGFPFRVSISELSDGPRVVEEYAAHADEGVRVIRTRLIVNGEFDIWTAGDDGLARRY